MKVIVAIIGIALVLALIVVCIVLVITNARLRRLVKGLDQPELWLPRKERQAHARKLLKREDDEYQQQFINKIMSGELPGATPPKGMSL